MSIAIPVPSVSNDITTYDGLIVALTQWLDDSSLETTAPQLIFLAEAYLRREVKSQSREGVATLTAAAAIILPTDFISLRSAWLDTDPVQSLVPMSPNTAHTFWQTAATGRPLNYQIVGDSLLLSPSPDSDYSVKIIYDRKLASLFPDNQSNWLIEEHPDVYLWACLIQSELLGWNDERIPLLKSALDEAIAGVNMQANRRRYGPGLRMRPASYF